MSNYAKNKILVGLILAVVTFASWVCYHEYEIWRDSKPTVTEKAKTLIEKAKRKWGDK